MTFTLERFRRLYVRFESKQPVLHAARATRGLTSPARSIEPGENGSENMNKSELSSLMRKKLEKFWRTKGPESNPFVRETPYHELAARWRRSLCLADRVT